MNRRTTASLLLMLGTLPLLGGCSTLTGPTASAVTSALPEASPLLDHYIAWIPREQAQTATVAEALAQVTLINAREQTAHRLCAGHWVMTGKVREQVGPLAVNAPGGYPAWYYRVSHQPGLQGCGHREQAELYRGMQANLPAWLNIRTAQAVRISRYAQ